MAKPAPVQVSFKDAIDMAIFAINTWMHPEASSAGDISALEILSDDIIATLVEIREILKGDDDA
jgi:hypothetical protein